MKTIFPLTLILAATLCFQHSHAQDVRKGNPGMWPALIKFSNNTPAFSRGTIPMIDDNGASVVLTGAKVKQSEKDRSGFEHIRYQQQINGLAVEHAFFIQHVKNGKLLSQNGKWIKDIPAGLPTTALIPERSALKNALEKIGAQQYKWELPAEETFLKREQQNSKASFYPKGKLVYYSGEKDVVPAALRLAWQFDIYAQSPLSRQVVFVDATNGAILGSREMIHHTDVPGTAQTAYSGTQAIVTNNNNGVYSLRESVRGTGSGIYTYNLQQGVSYGTAVDFTDADNSWNNINAAKDEYATDAHWATEKTYDYYLQTFGRNSIDGNGMALNSYVHYSTNYFNAFWDGSRMTYGDGDGAHGNKPLTSLDVCGHEITHGITERTSALAYSYESGAMNEGFSDIFGTGIEAFARPGSNDWLIGGDFYTIRSMSNPNAFNQPDTYEGNYWYFGSLDYGGVHTNSGVLNYWFYLLVNGGSGVNDHGTAYAVSPIGRAQAEAIAYRLNTFYLISTADYYSARLLGIQAAEDLYGIGSDAAIQTANAWTAVGLYASTCAEVSGLNANPILDRSATVNWATQSGASNYKVIYKAGSSSSWSTAVATTNNNLNLVNLSPATVYDWGVRSSCNASYVYSQFTTAAPICNAPGNLSAVVSASSATLSWTIPFYALNYDIEYKRSVDNSWLAAGTVTGTSYTLNGLDNSTVYDWRIKTNCNFGSSSYAQSQFTTNAVPCSTPAGMLFTYANNVSSCTWNAVQGAIEYRVQINWAGANWGTSEITVPSNSYNITNLMQGGNFQLRVRANCGGSFSLYSNTLLFSTSCSTPVSQTTTNITTGGATLNWVPAVGNNNNTAFVVAYRLANSSNAWTQVGSTTATTMNVSGLQAGTNYEWSVKKECTGGFSGMIIATFTTLSLPCTMPAGLGSSGITATQATISWAAVSGAVNYAIQYKPVSGITWSAIATTTGTSFGIGGLNPSTQYDWRVRTNCSQTSSNFAAAQFSTLAANACAVPSLLGAINISNTSATLNWSAANNANNYTLQYKISTASTWTTISNISSTSYALSNLAMNTSYSYKVRSNCNSGASNYSNEGLFTTLNCASNGNSNGEWIDLFKLGSINRTSGADAGGYINTGLSTNLVIGSSTNAAQISAGFPGAAVKQNYSVYIDFNRNGSFGDANERVAGASLITTNATISFNIPIPATATAGTTGMRVVMRRNADGVVGPCNTGIFGETEDYTVNLTTTSQRTGNNQITRTAIATTHLTGIDESAKTISVSPNPSNGLFLVSLPKTIEVSSYEIINTNGMTVQKGTAINGISFTVDISNKPAGLYLLRINSRNGSSCFQKLQKN